MQSFWAMVLANLKMTVRNKQAIFWNLAFPAIFILMFGAVFSNSGLSAFDVGIAGANSDLRASITQAMEGSDAFNVHQGTTDDELDALRNDDRSVVLVFPEDGSGDTIEMYASSAGGPNGQIATGTVRSVVMVRRSGASSGIGSPTAGWYGLRCRNHAAKLWPYRSSRSSARACAITTAGTPSSMVKPAARARRARALSVAEEPSGASSSATVAVSRLTRSLLRWSAWCSHSVACSSRHRRNRCVRLTTGSVSTASCTRSCSTRSSGGVSVGTHGQP